MTAKKRPASRGNTEDSSNQKGSNVPRGADTKAPGVEKTPNIDDGTNQRGSNVSRNANTRPKASDGGAGTPR